MTCTVVYRLARKCGAARWSAGDEGDDGIVGGGGIGATLNTAFSRYEFDTAAAILIIIIAIVMTLEFCSGFLRKWVQ